MLYSTIQHDTLIPGQAWACVSECIADRLVIVAVHDSPGGIAVNLAIEVSSDSETPQKILAPIAWTVLEPDLEKSVETGIDTSDYQADYQEWKRIANEGQAGVWTCSIEKIVQTVTSANTDS